MIKPIHKYNGGIGATLCHRCRIIITTGLSEALYCSSCLEKNNRILSAPETKYMPQQSEMIETLISEIKPQDELYKQQTTMTSAVEWFQEQIIKIVNGKCELSEIQIFQQAKQMEKEQIMMAVKDSWYMAKGSNFQEPQEEQYYNETYKR